MKDFIVELLGPASQMALEYREKLSGLQVNHKSTKDFVTEADQAIEKKIRETIRCHFPDHALCGEEYGNEGEGRHRWIVDPIDGTSSFVFGQPFFSISIAYEYDGVVQCGAVCSPVLSETFIAEKSKGAELNGKPIKVSQRNQLNQCILSTGFACIRADLEKNNLPYVNALLPKLCDMRRYGSAALDLAYVAAGRLDGFWELNLNLYDIAAGKLLVEEAGGKVSDFQGKQLGSEIPQIFASNGIIHQEIIKLFEMV
jgi:myo-inositol-1(or 4)-monophosphatase